MRHSLYAVVILGCVAAGCASPTATPEPTPTPVPTATATVVATTTPVVIVVTATTQPTAEIADVETIPAPKDENAPAAPPTAAGAVAVTGITGQAIVDAFKAAGLEAESPTPMGRDDYGLGPMVCTGVRFLIPSMGADKGGRAFTCESGDDMQLLADYYEGLGKASAVLGSWVFRNEGAGVLVQVNGELPEDQARKYETVVAGLGQ